LAERLRPVRAGAQSNLSLDLRFSASRKAGEQSKGNAEEANSHGKTQLM
jgi:hypothetical protein